MTLIFFIGPLIYLIYVGFFKWDGLSPKVFAGLANYKSVFKDTTFRMAFKNTLVWMATATFIHIPFGLLLALLLNKKPKGWKLFRFVYFIPNVISTTAIAFLWYFIYHVDVGLLNGILRFLKLSFLAHPWLNDPKTALFCNQVPFALYAGLTMVYLHDTSFNHIARIIRGCRGGWCHRLEEGLVHLPSSIDSCHHHESDA